MNLLDYIEQQAALKPIPNRLTIQERFDAFHASNPHVFKMFVQYARQAKARGYDKFSAKAIFERLRWYFSFETESEDEFKLNNDYTALYARKAIKEFPEFEGFFELRERLVK